MTSSPSSRIGPLRRLTSVVVPIALGLVFAVADTDHAGAAAAPVGLGTASSFAVLAGETVTNTGPSTLDASLGISPGTAVTGFPPGLVSGGSIHSADGVAAQAKSDLITAYNDAAGRATIVTVSADLGSTTLVPGVYTGGALSLTGTVTLDGQGDPNSVFVFQTASTLITASASKVALINGASACNVFWQVTSSATLGTNSLFVGTVLALTSIAAATGASINGRLLARNGAVTLDSNTFTSRACASGSTATTTPGGTATTTPGGTPNTSPRIPATGAASPWILGLALILASLGVLMVIAVRRDPRRLGS